MNLLNLGAFIQSAHLVNYAKDKVVKNQSVLQVQGHVDRFLFLTGANCTDLCHVSITCRRLT